MNTEIKDQAIVVCRTLYCRLAEEFPKTKHRLPKKGSKNYERWIKDAELLLGKDKAEFEDVVSVINWVFDGGSDSFWIPNIRSVKKLRQHFDRLLIQRDIELKRFPQIHSVTREMEFPDNWRAIIKRKYPSALIPTNPMNLPEHIKKELNGNAEQKLTTT